MYRVYKDKVLLATLHTASHHRIENGILYLYKDLQAAKLESVLAVFKEWTYFV